MSSPNPILTTIIFVLTVQAILFSGLILFKKPRKQSNIFLGLIVFFFALMSMNIALVNILLTYDIFHLFRYFQLELLYGIGPALFLYTKTITDPSYKFSKQDYWHFFPLLLEFIFYRTAFYRLGADGLYQSTPHPYTKIYMAEQWIGIASITVYCLLSLRMLFKHQSWLKENYSNIENKSASWLQAPILIYAGFWIGWNILTEIDRFIFERALRGFYFLPTFVGLAIVTCWIGFKGYLNTKIEVEDFGNAYSPTPTAKPQIGSDPQQKEFAKKIKDLMEKEKPYLNPELSLSKLAELLDINPKQVSATINQYFSKNFYEFINYYRVEEFKERMFDPNRNQLTLLGHAYECGFKSKSTFNDVFKKNTGKTPSQYVKQLEN